MNQIDRVTPSKILVTGALPPEGRDIDLVVDPATQAAIGRSLGEGGWLNKGHQWVLFEGDEVTVLDLAPAESWGLSPTLLDDLFGAAIPIYGRSNLLRLAPHHFILHSARRVGEGRAELNDKRRARIDDALREDPDAWRKAEELAEGWGARTALASLCSAFERGTEISKSAKIKARAERKRLADGSRLGVAPVLLQRATQRRRGSVIALSGIDGSGKSSQVKAVEANLKKLGYDATSTWNRLAVDPSLDKIAGPIKKVIRMLTGAPASGPKEKAEREADPARVLRKRAPLVMHAWTLVVATMNGMSHRRTTAPAKKGSIVVCDRYNLDSAVNLRYLYGSERRFKAQRWVVRRLSPKPLAAFYLDVSGATAHQRKPVKYTPEQLQAYADLYREEWRHEGAILLDGERPAGDITASIMRALWNVLP